jgi:hypothetical protein
MLPSDCLASFSPNDIKYLRNARRTPARASPAPRSFDLISCGA